MNKNKCSLAFLLLCFTAFTKAYSQYSEDSLIKGKITDTIFCKKNKTYSYALYLPSSYHENIRWPVVFVFDPGANGKKEANLFVETAEKYGYILVCSNNSKNGQFDANVEAVNYTFEDALSRFAINENRIYTAGYSGGSRVALYIALETKKIAGVIGFAAGYPVTGDLKLPTDKKFIYIGLIGKRDPNYKEMIDLEKIFEKSEYPVRLIISERKHQLPSKQSILNAVEWLELNAMKNNQSKINPELIHEIQKKYCDTIANCEKSNNVIGIADNLKYLLNDFAGLADLHSFQIKYDSVIHSELYRKARMNENEIFEIEKNTISNYSSRSFSIKKSGEFIDSLYSWWITEIRLNNRMEKKNDPQKYLASRLNGTIYFIQNDLADMFLGQKKYSSAIKCYRLCCMAFPENWYSCYRLACVLALNKNNSAACKTIEKLIHLGYKNKKAIESEPAFHKLKETKAFKKILNTLEN